MSRDEPPFKTFFPTVLVLMTIGFFATDIYLPSLPIIRSRFDTTTGAVQLTLTFYLLAFSLTHLFFGPLSDKVGRRPMIFLGLFSSLVGTSLCATSQSIEMLIVGRLLQGAALGAVPGVARAILRDAYSGERLAWIGSFVPVGAAAIIAGAPALGGVIQRYFGWRMSFVFLLFLTVATLVMVLFWLPETLKERNPNALRPRVFFKPYAHLLTSPVFLGYCLCSSLSFAGLIAFFAISPFLFQDVIGLTPVAYGFLAFFTGGGIALGGYANSLLLRKFTRHQLLVVGIAIIFFSGLGMLVPALFGIISTLPIMIPMVVYTIGMGISFPNAFAGAFYPFAHIAGFAGALYSCLQLLSGAFTSGLTSLLKESNQIPLALILTFIGILSYILQVIAFKASLKSHHH